jgi:hypothetical protein
VRISLVGIDLISEQSRVVVASSETYLRYADSAGLAGMGSRPSLVASPAEKETNALKPSPIRKRR